FNKKRSGKPLHFSLQFSALSACKKHIALGIFILHPIVGLSAVPCRKFFGDVQAELELIITRNEVRRSKEVNPIRLSRQINAMKAQFGIKAGNNASSQGAYTTKELSVFFGKSIKHLNKLASLSKLHPESG
ncbi:hypothetical protein, partial [Ectobacillus ponti]